MTWTVCSNYRTDTALHGRTTPLTPLYVSPDLKYDVDRLFQLQDRHRAARAHHSAHADRIRVGVETLHLPERPGYPLIVETVLWAVGAMTVGTEYLRQLLCRVGCL